MKTHLNIMIIIILLMTFALMSFTNPSNEYSQENIRVIFLIDDSGSMANSDPSDLRYSAARLFVSLLDPGDSIGAVTFSDQAQVISSGIQTIHSMEDKLQLADVFQPGTPNGYTDVKAAFTQASELLLTDPSEPDQTIIVLLTDGQPEPLNYYSSYEDDTIELAKSLEIPVISIALTQGASINFLNRLSSQTSGNVYPAETALDLLDVYLNILSQWKHRTIIGESIIDCPSEETITIDQGLIPYINHISFAISKNDDVTMTLTDPEGTVVDENNPQVDFHQLNDTKFSVISLSSITAGDWKVKLDGSGNAQVRVIIDSNLQIDLPNLASFAEAGQPLLLEAEIIEIDSMGIQKRVVGEGSFSAIVISPDGTEESLDQFYDDSTHGDVTANDGLYSRIYSNTSTPGTYSIKLFGYKGLIPLQTERKINLITFPVISIESPQSIKYNLEDDEKIPLEIIIKTDERESLDAGDVKGKITNEKGDSVEIDLVQDGTKYTAEFLPSLGGHYILEIFVEDGVFQTMPYTHSETIEFDVYLIPKLVFELEANDGNILQVQNEEITRGIPIEITITSTADEAIKVSAIIEGGSEIYIDQLDQVTIPAGTSTTMELILKSAKELSLGEKNFQIVFTTDEDVTLVDSVIPISIQVYRPTITIGNIEPVICEEPIGCYWWQSDFILTILSSSKEEVPVTFEIVGNDSISLEESHFVIMPGKQDVRITLNNEKFVSQGTKDYSLHLTTTSEKAVIDPGSNEFNVQLILPSLLSRCKKTILWTSIGFIVLIVFIRILSKRLGEKKRETWVTGTLQYWDNNDPYSKTSVNLTDLRKNTLIIGTEPDCDILITGVGVDPHHIRLFTRKIDDQMEVILEPIGEVRQGYNLIVTELTLLNETTFSLGEIHCRYLSDSGY